MCEDCHGAGVLYGSAPMNGGNPSERPCYVSGCRGGWRNCNECNINGQGQNPGQCSNCKGTGFDKY